MEPEVDAAESADLPQTPSSALSEPSSAGLALARSLILALAAGGIVACVVLAVFPLFTVPAELLAPFPPPEIAVAREASVLQCRMLNAIVALGSLGFFHEPVDGNRRSSRPAVFRWYDRTTGGRGGAGHDCGGPERCSRAVSHATTRHGQVPGSYCTLVSDPGVYVRTVWCRCGCRGGTGGRWGPHGASQHCVWPDGRYFSLLSVPRRVPPWRCLTCKRKWRSRVPVRWAWITRTRWVWCSTSV